MIDLSKFDNSWYKPGRSWFVRTLWHFVNATLMQSHLNPSSGLKVSVLRCFGARIGSGAVIKPGVNIKYPWHLEIGDHCWVGENAWLDSLAPIRIGNNVCISQGTYFCTGNHDWSDKSFGLIVKGITVEDGAWVGARATILPGVTMANHSIASAGSVIVRSTEPHGIYTGNPAIKVKVRVLR